MRLDDHRSDVVGIKRLRDGYPCSFGRYLRSSLCGSSLTGVGAMLKGIALILMALAFGLLPLTALAFMRGTTERLMVVMPASTISCPSYKWEI